MFPHPRRNSEQPGIIQVKEDPDIIQVEEDHDIIHVKEDPDIIQVEEDHDIIHVEEDRDIIKVEEDRDIIQVEEDRDIIQVEEDPNIIQVEEDSDVILMDEEPLIYSIEDNDPILSVSQSSDIRELSSASDLHERTSPIELFVDVGEKVEVILGKIGGDINRALSAKRQRMEANARMSLEGIDQQMTQVWNSQEDAVAKLNEESAQSFMNLFQQWNSDFQKFREKHEKMMSDFQEQEKAWQQCRLIQRQRLGTIKQVREQFLQDLEELKIKNDNMFLSTQNELKEEMRRLRRKIMKES